MLFQKAAVQDPFYVGSLGPIKNLEEAGIRRQWAIGMLGLARAHTIQFAYGPEIYKIARKLSEYKWWNKTAQRFFSNLAGGTGLLMEIAPRTNISARYYCLLWPRPYREFNETYYPRLNIPSDITSLKGIKDVCKHLNLYHLTVYSGLLPRDVTDPSSRFTYYTFGTYHGIPDEYWKFSRKQKKSKRKGRVTFDGYFPITSRKQVGLGAHVLLEEFNEVFN